ncbi:lipoprotein insertase outer membrane protein LolB [Pseudoxanthomonas koreensis]|uniref:lipoprotein insertase outer membrane protein LolB n=1 Tax=Pseudoxanthomonas koreensis TaxID=266061 RepID=UPI0013917ECA|nr:lipoprotein insertase outer membrane protein LolB [Pseudoxanthomonas koreensis]KAF1691041.1 outer membrane lipoprotein LolB [Pseudoxanthomonas koreensis]
MSPRFRAAGLALATALLAACSGSPVRPPAPAIDAAQALARQQEREARLAAIGRWSLQGRLAVTVGDKGGSGRLDWQQDGDTFRISLGAPVTRQSWQLAGEPGGATLDGLEGGPRSGPDAEALLYQATGWPIPVASMAAWVRGLPGPDGGERVFGADGRLQRLAADGWVVEYQEWQPAAGPWPDMPRRLQATREGARVRLVVDRWDGPVP